MKTGNFPMVEFQETKRMNPLWSDYICFAETIKSRQNLSSKTIKKYFNVCVDKDDYTKSEKSAVLQHLINLSHGVAE